MKTNNAAPATPKKAGQRGKNYGHHSGLHGDARMARTADNKARRAAQRDRLAKRREAGLMRRAMARGGRWATKYVANLNRRIRQLDNTRPDQRAEIEVCEIRIAELRQQFSLP